MVWKHNERRLLQFPPPDDSDEPSSCRSFCFLGVYGEVLARCERLIALSLSLSWLLARQPASQSINFISPHPSPPRNVRKGSPVSQAVEHPWRMPRGSLCHVKVFNFDADYKDMQTQKSLTPKTPPTTSPIVVWWSVHAPWVNGCHGHTAAVGGFCCQLSAGRGYVSWWFLYFIVFCWLPPPLHP